MSKNTKLEALGVHWEQRAMWTRKIREGFMRRVWNWAEFQRVVKTGQGKEEEPCPKMGRKNELSTFRRKWIKW